MRALATLVAALALVGVAGATSHATEIVFERDVVFAMATTQGFEFVVPRASSFKHVAVEVTVTAEGCDDLAGAVGVTTTPPPPIPSTTFLTTVACSGAGAPLVAGVPGLPAYQGKGLPLLVDFAGAGEGVVRLTVLGERWS